VPLCLNLREDYWDWLRQTFPDNIAIHEAFKYAPPHLSHSLRKALR
jgi:hypothetical protein